jgi:hypothetical protein
VFATEIGGVIPELIKAVSPLVTDELTELLVIESAIIPAT